MRTHSSPDVFEAKLEAEGIKYYFAKEVKVVTTPLRTYKKVKPLIPPYIFVYGSYLDISNFKQHYDIISFIPVRSNGTHTTMKVSDKEMDDFIRVVERDFGQVRIFKANEIELAEGQRVRITGGDLDGVEGMLTREKGKRDKRLYVRVEGFLVASTPVEKIFVQLLD